MFRLASTFAFIALFAAHASVSAADKPVVRHGYVDSPYGQLHYSIATPRAGVDKKALPWVLFHQSPNSSVEYTELVEALGNNTNAVSTVEGAIGVNPELTNGKLTIVQNGDWNAFAAAVVTASTNKKEISPLFYNHFYWGYSTKKAAEFIEQ